MNISITKVVAISTLLLATINANATITLGELSIDEETNLMTGSNGKTYAGWGETLYGDYQQTEELTQIGGMYEGFYIANRSEAAEFFTLATGVAVPSLTDEHMAFGVTLPGELGEYCQGSGQPSIGCGDYTLGHPSEGDGLTFWFDEGTTDDYGNAWLGRMTFYGYANLFYWHDNEATPDCTGSCGVEDYNTDYRSNSAWLMVPEPTTSLILGFALLGLGFARKKKV